MAQIFVSADNESGSVREQQFSAIDQHCAALLRSERLAKPAAGNESQQLE
jgi:hypothetical protein